MLTRLSTPIPALALAAALSAGELKLHAIGDKAINMALNAFEYAATTNGTAGSRHRIEHVEVPLLSDFPRFKALGVIASTQPLFASPDQTVLQNFAVLLGPERASHADSFKLFDDAGAGRSRPARSPTSSCCPGTSSRSCPATSSPRKCC